MHIKGVLKRPFASRQVDFAAQVKTLQERNAEMEKKMSELKTQIQVVTVLLRVCRGSGGTQALPHAVNRMFVLGINAQGFLVVDISSFRFHLQSLPRGLSIVAFH